MEHTATSTLTREQGVEPRVDPLSEWPEIPLPPDVRPHSRRAINAPLAAASSVKGASSSSSHLVSTLSSPCSSISSTTHLPATPSPGWPTGSTSSIPATRTWPRSGSSGTPLQSLADMVFLLGNHLWPALSHNNMAGSLVSALAMAGAVYQMSRRRCASGE